MLKLVDITKHNVFYNLQAKISFSVLFSRNVTDFKLGVYHFLICYIFVIKVLLLPDLGF